MDHTVSNPRKGNLVALQRNHCSIDVHFNKKSWHSYRLAKVTKVTREGRVTEVSVLGSNEIVEIRHPFRVFTISGSPEHKEGAMRLAKAITTETNNWDDGEKLKAAILHAFHFGRVMA